jgi:periplasmic protein TonB
MGSFMKRGRRSNRLFKGILILSAGIHTVLFLHIGGIYRSQALSVIELTIQDVPKPAERNIPRPLPRVTQHPEPVNLSRTVHPVAPIPSVKPIEIESLESPLSDRIMERSKSVSAPQAPRAVIPGVDFIAAGSSSFSGYNTSDAYLEMVRSRIETRKRYPQQARASFKEGRVLVRFTVAADGGIRSLGVGKSSKTKVLDEAALQAVRSAAPFPAPPRRLFKGEIPLELTIVFELR